MEKKLIELGYRKFTPANADNTTAFMRSYKTFTVFAVKHPQVNVEACMISFTFGKTEICLPNFFDIKWIETLHKDQTNP